MATHSSVLVWRILGTAEPGGLLPMGSHRVRHDWSDLEAAAAASLWGLPWWFIGKEPLCQCRRHRFYPWVRRLPGEGNGNALRYSCLGNPMGRGTWQAIVHGVTKVRHDLATKNNNNHLIRFLLHVCCCLVIICVWLFCNTPWTIAHQALLSMGFLRQE